MSVAPPPDPLVPIFNPLYWETAADGAAITTAYLNANYLKFPFAQGTENMQNTNVVGTLAVSGITTLNDPVQINDTLTSTSTVTLGSVSSSVPTCLASYAAVTPTDNTNKIPTTAWVQTALGAYVATNVISIQTFTGNSTITFPTNTQYATIMLSGSGGNSGGAYYDSGSASVTAGGGGGAGGFVYFNRLPMEAGANMSCSFSSGSATLYYTPIAQTSYYATTTSVAIASAGGNGATATGPGGNPSGGFGGGLTLYLTGFGIGLNGGPGGAGQSTSSSFQILRAVNYLSALNQLAQISPSTPPLNYGIGGYTRINNGAGNDYTINPPGPAVCIVISYSS